MTTNPIVVDADDEEKQRRDNAFTMQPGGTEGVPLGVQGGVSGGDAVTPPDYHAESNADLRPPGDTPPGDPGESRDPAAG